MHRETRHGRTGPLRNGNPRGKPNLAPRCGARTRAGCACRVPAMANGRCRMHGGLSRGPTTEAGRARLRAAHTVHGGYGAESVAAQRQTAAFIAGMRGLLAALKRRRGGTGVGAAQPECDRGSGDVGPKCAVVRQHPMHSEKGGAAPEQSRTVS